MTLPTIAFMLDFDDTLSSVYQQEPLFQDNFDKIKSLYDELGIKFNTPLDYFNRTESLGLNRGVGFLTTMIWDAAEGKPLEGLTLERLTESGKRITPATGIPDFFPNIKQEFNGKANIEFYIVSVGISHIIEGFLTEHNLTGIISGVAGAEFTINNEGVINGIKKAVTPFEKNAPIIEFAKGGEKTLDKLMNKEDYALEYNKIIAIGDGFSDIAMLSQTKKKGGTAVCVYKPEDLKAFSRAKQLLPRINYLLPRDYSSRSQTYELLCEAVQRKIDAVCNYDPEVLHKFGKSELKNEGLRNVTLNHIDNCGECPTYFTKTIVTPNGVVEIKKSEFK